MIFEQSILTIRTPGRGLTDITRSAAEFVAGSGVLIGLLTLFIRHTSAGLIIQENADPDVLADLNDFLFRLVPDGDPRHRHSMEGPDDMPAHIRSVLTATSVSIPVAGGRPVLGTWQGIYLFEHRTAPHDRQIVLHLSGR